MKKVFEIRTKDGRRYKVKAKDKKEALRKIDKVDSIELVEMRLGFNEFTKGV
jgi:hypothetical protein